jgi:hypothetical protein
VTASLFAARTGGDTADEFGGETCIDRWGSGSFEDLVQVIRHNGDMELVGSSRVPGQMIGQVKNGDNALPRALEIWFARRRTE